MKKIEKKFIAEDERELAAKYFTLSNTAMLHMIRGNNLNMGYYHADECMQSECGASLRDELNDWRKTIKKGDSYCFEEWEKVKKDYVSHFTSTQD